jgi:hypothetical protein
MATDMEIIKHMGQLRLMISSMRPHNGPISMEMDMETIHWASSPMLVHTFLEIQPKAHSSVAVIPMVISGPTILISSQSMKLNTMIQMGMDMETTSLEPIQMLALNQQVNQPEIDLDV